MEAKIQVGDLFARVVQIAIRGRMAIVVYFAALVTCGTAIDYYFGESRGYLLLANILSVIAGYLLMRALMDSERLAGGDAGFSSYFGLTIIVGIGTVVGFLFLIIPGVILAIRWMPAYALLLSGDEPATGAPGASWDLTKGQFWPLLAALLLGLAPLLAISIGIGMFEGFAEPEILDGSSYVVLLALTNVVVAAFTFYTSALGIATYLALTGDRQEEVSEVFA